MSIKTKKSKTIQDLTMCLWLVLMVSCLFLASCYTLYPAPGTSSAGNIGSSTTTVQAQASGNTQGSNTTPVAPPEPPPLTGTLVPGDTLTEKLAWLQRSADSHNTYILLVSADENIAPSTLEYRGAINITIALRGDGANRTIRLSSNGTMFTVRSNVTFVLENNITLMGHSGNSGVMVYVSGGTFRMRTGSCITGNVKTNTALNYGSGVIVGSGTFEMTGGAITGNTAAENNSSYSRGTGGGVYVNQGTFSMSGGNISGNSARYGGGIYVDQNGTFTMVSGTISDNAAWRMGGGVFVNWATFNMRGGTITSNTARSEGGGVFINWSPNFSKTGGTITGYNSDPGSGNTVKDESGNILARKGHAIFVNAYYSSGRQEITAGPVVRLSASSYTFTGSWEKPGSGNTSSDGTGMQRFIH